MKQPIFTGKIKDQKLSITRNPKFDLFIGTLEGQEVEIIIKRKVKRRSDRQNRALHLYFTQLSEALNESGHDMKKTLRQDVDIPWTPLNVKEHLWRPLMDAYLNIKSTTQMKTHDIDKIYDILNKTIGERTGVFVAWPCIESLMDNEQ